MEKWRRDFRKEEYCQVYYPCSLKESTQIEWSISKKPNNERAYNSKNEGKKNHFDYCFEFDTKTISRFVRKSFYRLSKFKKLPVVYFVIYQKESDKNVYFGNFFNHWLKIEQLGKNLIEFSNIGLNIGKIM